MHIFKLDKNKPVPNNLGFIILQAGNISMFNFKEIISVSLILFSVIDILGSIPVIIDLRKKFGHIQSEKATDQY